MSSREFVLWKRYMRQAENHFHREDYFLAQIAAEVARMRAAKPENVKVEDYLIKFHEKGQPRELSEEEEQARLAASKARWAAILTGKGNAEPK